MNIMDITGTIHDRFRPSAPPFPSYRRIPIEQPAWVEHPVYMDHFSGMHSQTGTYLETPAHWRTDSYPLIDVPVEKLTDIPCVLLWIGERTPCGSRQPVSLEQIDAAIEAAGEIKPGSAILVGCGWGKYWFESYYGVQAPYFSKQAMERIISLKPFLLGSDIPAWECRQDPQNFFEDFYAADILMLAPVVNLEKLVGKQSLHLTALPLKIENTCCTPCRAVVKYE